jgi:sugar phosphate isomerase/epimerase
MKFSTFNITTPDWTPREAAVELKALGFDGVAWRIVDQKESEEPGFWIGNRSTWPLTGLEESLPEMVLLRDETGLTISAFYGYPRWNDHEAVERQLRACAAIGVKVCRVVGPGKSTFGGGPLPQLGLAPFDELLEASRRDWKWVADCASEHGVKAVTPLHHEWVNASASGSRRMLDGLDPAAVGIIADWGHLAIEGWEDPLATVQILGPYLDSVMLKNFGFYPTRQRTDRTIVWEYRSEPLRSGRVDIPNVMAALNAESFDGWVTLAETAGDQPTRDRLADSLSYVKAAAAATAGAKREDWIYSYGPRSGMWSGLELGVEL